MKSDSSWGYLVSVGVAFAHQAQLGKGNGGTNEPLHQPSKSSNTRGWTLFSRFLYLEFCGFLILAASRYLDKILISPKVPDSRLAPLAAAAILQQTLAATTLSSSPLVRQSPFSTPQVMPENTGNPPQTQSQGSSRGRRNHGRRGGRGGRAPKATNGPSEGSRDAPALSGNTDATSTSTQNQSIRGSNSRPRGNRNRQPRRQNGDPDAAANVSRPATRRAFGGHLTSNANEVNEASAVTSSGPAGLSADAPEFVPGQPVASRR